MFYTYILLMIIAFALSVYIWRTTDKKVMPLPVILLLGIVTEVAVIVLKRYKLSHYPLYHIYIPAEYTLWALFFAAKAAGKKIRPFMLYSIPVYLVTSIIISVFFYGIYAFPSLNFNIEGFFVIVWSVWLINSFDEFEETSISQKPAFWLCMGLIVFFAGNFIFNGFYNYLRRHDKDLAATLTDYINNGLNIFLYITMSTSFICSLRTGKY